MKKLIFLLSALIVSATFAVANPLDVEWQVCSYDSVNRISRCQFILTNTSGAAVADNWALYFNSFPRRYTPAAGAPITFETVQTGYFCVRPTAGFRLDAGKTVALDYEMVGTVNNPCYAPDGGHITFGNSAPEAAPIKHRPIALNIYPRHANFPTPQRLFDLYESVGGYGSRGSYDILPALKHVATTDEVCPIGTFRVCAVDGLDATADYARRELKRISRYGESGTTVELQLLSRSDARYPEGKTNAEYYEIDVTPERWRVAGVSREAVLNGVKTVVQLIRCNARRGAIEAAHVCDAPDLHYRGIMLDVSRNFYPLSTVRRMLAEVAMFKINRFHFHFTDDEGWRLQIPGLPELTDVGARRGLTRSETDFMCQFYNGDGNPDSPTTANGYITVDEFVDFLRFADSIGVEVIPEIESPGHARAAITAMRARYRRYAATDSVEAWRYRLDDPADSSVYTSAQGYHDNVLNPAMEGSYRFMEKVIDEIAAMYERAGVNLPYIHVGGDEVPRNPWAKSPAVQSLMQRHGFTTTHDVEQYYITRIADIADAKGIRIGGWQEAAMRHSAEVDERLRDKFGGVYCWQTVPDWGNDTVPYTVANNGYRVVLCNVGNFYFDMAYNPHPAERGLNWGGYTDEYRAWDARPFDIYRSSSTRINGEPLDSARLRAPRPVLDSRSRKMIQGVQAQIFAETIRRHEMVEYLLFPKVFGLAERGWNAELLPGQTKAQYNALIGESLLPQLSDDGLNFHVGMPGITQRGGRIVINCAYPQAQIRYTTDGSEPTADSPLYTAPLRTRAKTIRAKTFYLGRESLTTVFER